MKNYGNSSGEYGTVWVPVGYLVELDGLCGVAEGGGELPDEGGLAAAPGPHQAQVHHSVGHHQLAQQARVVRRTHVLCTQQQ